MTNYSIFYVDKHTGQIKEVQAVEENLAEVWERYKGESALCFRWLSNGYGYVGCHNGPFVEKNPR